MLFCGTECHPPGKAPWDQPFVSVRLQGPSGTDSEPWSSLHLGGNPLYSSPKYTVLELGLSSPT